MKGSLLVVVSGIMAACILISFVWARCINRIHRDEAEGANFAPLDQREHLLD